MIRLCVTFKSSGTDRRSKVKIDLNEEPNASDGHENDHHYVCEDVDSLHISSKGYEYAAPRNDAFKRDPYSGEDDAMSGKVTYSQKKNRRVIDDFKKHQHFKSKEDMRIAFENVL